jgi:hypothetical protein
MKSRMITNAAWAALTLALLAAAPATGRAESARPYTAPAKWLGVAAPAGYADAYWTTVDDERRVTVWIRPRYTGGKPALEWLTDEASSLQSDGARTGRVRAEKYANLIWYYVDWKDPAAGTRGRRYYLEVSPGELAEVSLSAEDAVFKSTDASEFDPFLSSFTVRK